MFSLKKIGALTSKNFTFKGRSWEVKSLRSLDIFDIISTDLKVDYRYNKVVRIVTVKDFKNFFNNFITDNCRFFFDSLYFQRVTFPLLRLKDYYISVSWFKIFFFFKVKVSRFKFFFNKIYVYSLLGNFLDFKSLIFFKKFLNELGSNFFFNNFFFFFFEEELLDNFVDKQFLQKIVNEKTSFFFFGFNSRTEFPIIYRSLKKKIKNGLNFYKIFNFCSKVLDFSKNSYKNFGINFFNFFKFFLGNYKFSRFFFKFFKKSIFIFGLKFFQNISTNYYFLLKDLFFKLKIFKNNITKFLWIKNSLDFLYNIPYFSISTKKELGYLSTFYGKIGFLNQVNQKLNSRKILFILDSNEIYFENIFDIIIYQGVHMDLNFFKGNIIMPIVSFFESTFFFFDFFGIFKKVEHIGLENIEKKRSSNLVFISFNNFFLNFIFYKFGFSFFRKKESEVLFLFYFKFFLLKVLGLPNLQMQGWWDFFKIKKIYIKLMNFINVFLVRRNSFQNFNGYKIFYSNKIFLSFFFNVYKISSYTRFSKNLIIASIKNRKFNFK